MVYGSADGSQLVQRTPGRLLFTVLLLSNKLAWFTQKEVNFPTVSQRTNNRIRYPGQI